MMRCRRCEAIGFGVATGLAVLLIAAGWWLQVPEPGGGGSGGQTVAVALAMFKADAAPAKMAGVAPPEDSEPIREVPERLVRAQPPEPDPEPQKPDSQAKSTPRPAATSRRAPEPETALEPTPQATTKPQPARPAPVQPQPAPRPEPEQARRPAPTPEPERAVRPQSPAMQHSAEQRVAKADTKPSRSPASGGAGPRTAEKAVSSGLDPSYKTALRAAIEANKRYPRHARMRRQEGEVTVGFTVHADGRISDVHIVGGAVSRSLERAAREAVTRVGRFRPLPDNAPSKPMRLRIAMRFDLG